MIRSALTISVVIFSSMLSLALAQGQDFAAAGQHQPVAAATPSQQLDQALERAVEQVLRSARSDDEFLRANAVEASQKLSNRVQPLVQLALDDPSSVVRFTALATIGQLKLAQMIPSVEGRLNDDDESVRMAALFALHQCGRPVDITPLAGMLASRNPAVRRNAVMLVGMMGEASAVPMILDGVNTPMPKENAVHNALARIQAAEAIAKLTARSMDPELREYEDQSLNALRAGMYSSEDEVRVMSVLLLGRVGDKSMRPAVELLLEEPPIELQLAAADYMARTGQPAGVNWVIQAAASPLVAVRAQAAMTLAELPESQSAGPLIALLDDPSEIVRLSAAAAIINRNRMR